MKISPLSIVFVFALLGGGAESGRAGALVPDMCCAYAGEGYSGRSAFAQKRWLVAAGASSKHDARSEEYFIARNTEAARLHAEGRVSEAEGILRAVLKEAIARLGAGHKYTVLTMLNLAEVCIYQHQYREAAEFLDAVVSVYRTQIGADHHKTADMIVRLASVHFSLGQIEETKPLFEEVLRIRRKSLGAMHPDTLLALDALGGVHYSLGRFGEARRLYTEALEGFEKTIGPMHEQTQRTRQNLTQVPTEWPEQSFPALQLRQF